MFITLEEMPREAETDIQSLKRFGIASFFVVPILISNELTYGISSSLFIKSLNDCYNKYKLNISFEKFLRNISPFLLIGDISPLKFLYLQVILIKFFNSKAS